jgi:hypothetical protein
VIDIWLACRLGKRAVDLHRSMGFGRVATVHCRRCGVEPLAVTG